MYSTTAPVETVVHLSLTDYDYYYYYFLKYKNLSKIGFASNICNNNKSKNINFFDFRFTSVNYSNHILSIVQDLGPKL